MALLQWGRWYASVNEMSPADRPTDALIEDDAALDRWFDSYMRDVQRKAGRSRGAALNPQTQIPQYTGA